MLNGIRQNGCILRLKKRWCNPSIPKVLFALVYNECLIWFSDFIATGVTDAEKFKCSLQMSAGFK